MLGPRTRSAAQREDVRAAKVEHEESGDDEHSPKKAKIGNARLRAAQKNGNGGAGVSAAAAASTLYAIMHHSGPIFLSLIHSAVIVMRNNNFKSACL